MTHEKRFNIIHTIWIKRKLNKFSQKRRKPQSWKAISIFILVSERVGIEIQLRWFWWRKIIMGIHRYSALQQWERICFLKAWNKVVFCRDVSQIKYIYADLYAKWFLVVRSQHAFFYSPLQGRYLSVEEKEWSSPFFILDSHKTEKRSFILKERKCVSNLFLYT